MFDEIKTRFFDNTESYNKAMKLLDKYDVEAIGSLLLIDTHHARPNNTNIDNLCV